MNNKPFGKPPGKFYQSIFRHIRIQKPDRGRGSPGPTPKLLCRVQTPRGQRAQRQPSNTPSSNQRTPKPSAPTGEGGPPIGSAPRTSGRPHPRPPTGLSPRIPPSELTPLVSTPSMPTPGTTLQPGPGESKGGPQAKGKLGGGAQGSPPFTLVAGGGSAEVSWMPRPRCPRQQAGLATGPISTCNYEGTQCLSSIRYHSVSAVGGQHLNSKLHGTAGSRAGIAGRCRGISGNNHITQVLTFRLPFSLSLPPSLKSHLLPDCLRSPGWSGGGWQ